MFYSEIPKPKISTLDLPWLWVGVELTNGKIETITELVNSKLSYGDLVNSELLEKITKIKNSKRWLYLDSTTLNEQEFPTEGILIKDDSNEQGHS